MTRITDAAASHSICTCDGSARAVPTLTRAGVYAVSRDHDCYIVSHTLTGTPVGDARTVQGARALAEHFHRVAPDAGADLRFGADLWHRLSADDYVALDRAIRTRPRFG